MRIHHFNTYPYGGAATAAKRIHAPLSDLGHISQFFYRIDNRSDSQIFDESLAAVDLLDEQPASWFPLFQKRQEKNRRRKIHQQYDTHLRDRDGAAENFSMAELPEITRLSPSMLEADIIQLHWISHLADYPSFFASIPDEKPIVWTLHDMNPFTGGCHYDNGCKGFLTECGKCPQIVQLGPRDVSFASFRIKQESLANKNITVVTPSRWLGDLARQSKLWPQNTSFEHIPYGLDLTRFRPIPKHKARRELGIQSDAVLIAFGAEDIRNHRKGFHHLVNCLPKIPARSKFECLVFGSGEIPSNVELPTMHEMGFVNSAELQSKIYSAADLVVVPSLEDNQPQVGLEAMACETPVIGFRAGGIPEYVRDGVTGLLARVGNESELAAQIGRLVDHTHLRKEMGRNALEMIRNEFESVTQGKRYVELYRSLLRKPSRIAA